MSIFPSKVLLATDGSREAELAARTAADLSQKTDSELHVVHAFGIVPVGPPVYPEATDLQSVDYETQTEERQRISEQRAREVLEAEVEKIRSAGGTVAQEHLIEGWVAPAIVTLAEEIGAGLIVMGSRGLGGIRRALMGSVSDSVVRHAHCPVLVCASNAAPEGLSHRPHFTQQRSRLILRTSPLTNSRTVRTWLAGSLESIHSHHRGW